MLKKTIFLLLVLIAFNACQSVKDGLTGKKQNNTDEFLIEKKNPLVLPPQFNELPEPKIAGKTNEKEIDLKIILRTKRSSSDLDKTGANSSKSLEKSILDKIKDN
tara:strand:- start:31 stop:345 length:315 start_codon:yes stop_codon:yes gene_type:complete